MQHTASYCNTRPKTLQQETDDRNVATFWQCPQHPAFSRLICESSSWQVTWPCRWRDKRHKCSNMLAASATSSIEALTHFKLACRVQDRLHCPQTER
mmetsp:Transcript_70848/g.103819  ORF Transcript_70848/g.103819 Transcript_70848/m.103819 type:complete len:97 (+) Transcript_70848:88-378(+)